MNKKVLIIGSQGYLGTRLVEYLIERDYFCGVIDTGFFKDGLLYNSKIIETIKKDAREITRKDIEGYSCVVMLAVISNDPFGNLDPKLSYDPTRHYTIKIANKIVSSKLLPDSKYSFEEPLYDIFALAGSMS